MADESATTPLASEEVRQWAAEWGDTFEQEWTDESLNEWVGKTVKTTAEVNGEPKGGTYTIIGYGRETLCFEASDEDGERSTVNRYMFMTREGFGVPIFARTVIEEVVEE